MYYTHEYSNEQFDSFEECANDLMSQIDIDEYEWYIGAFEILRKFFRRKSDEEFCFWLSNSIEAINSEIQDALISEHEDEEESEDDT